MHVEVHIQHGLRFAFRLEELRVLSASSSLLNFNNSAKFKSNSSTCRAFVGIEISKVEMDISIRIRMDIKRTICQKYVQNYIEISKWPDGPIHVTSEEKLLWTKERDRSQSWPNGR